MSFLWQQTFLNPIYNRLVFSQSQDEAQEVKDPTKFGGKKSKAAAKKGAGSTQWDILRMSGIPEEEISQVRTTPAAVFSEYETLRFQIQPLTACFATLVP